MGACPEKNIGGGWDLEVYIDLRRILMYIYAFKNRNGFIWEGIEPGTL